MRVTVTGGAGFLGQHVCCLLRAKGHEVFTPRSAEYDLREKEACRALLDTFHPDAVIHLAATCGGIGANLREPGRFFYDNAIMGLQLMEQARLAGVKKFLCASSVCAYPKFCPVPFKEEDLWNGYPEETNAPYGLAKRMLLVQAQAYRQQYHFNAVTVIPVNLYGPGDCFDPERSHVIPALIRKAIEARESGADHLEVWGSGTATREFLFVEDAAEGIVRALERLEGPEPVNLGTGHQVTVASLASLICDLCGFTGQIRWNTSKPDGQPQRCLDVRRAKELLGWRAKTSLTDGLRKTIAWYKENSCHIRPISFAPAQEPSTSSATRLRAMILIESVPVVRDGQVWKVREPLALRILAAWYRGEADSPRHYYEGEVLLRFPGKEQEPFTVPIDRFEFRQSYHRVTVPRVEVSSCPRPGVLVVETRIRLVGSGDWLGKQAYPILLEEFGVEC